MSSQHQDRRLLTSRLSAVIAACVAVALATTRILLLHAHAPARPQWIHHFDEILPPNTRIALHLLGYGVLLVWFIEVLREHRGAERIFFALLIMEGLLYPALVLSPMSVVSALFWAQLAANFVMLGAALKISLDRRNAADEAPARSAP